MAKKRTTPDLSTEKRLAELKDQFIDAYVASVFNITKAMQSVGVRSRTTIWNWRRNDPDFNARLMEAREQEGDWYENQLRVLASGIPRLDKDGRLIGWEEKPDATAINSVLNAKFRDRGYGYRVKHEMETTGGADATPKLDVSRLTAKERETLNRLITKMKTGPGDDVQDAEIVDG